MGEAKYLVGVKETIAELSSEIWSASLRGEASARRAAPFHGTQLAEHQLTNFIETRRNSSILRS